MTQPTGGDDEVSARSSISGKPDMEQRPDSSMSPPDVLALMRDVAARTRDDPPDLAAELERLRSGDTEGDDK